MKRVIASLTMFASLCLGTSVAYAGVSPNYLELPDWIEDGHAPVTAAAAAPNYLELPDWIEDGTQAQQA